MDYSHYFYVFLGLLIIYSGIVSCVIGRVPACSLLTGINLLDQQLKHKEVFKCDSLMVPAEIVEDFNSSTLDLKLVGRITVTVVLIITLIKDLFKLCVGR